MPSPAAARAPAPPVYFSIPFAQFFLSTGVNEREAIVLALAIATRRAGAGRGHRAREGAPAAGPSGAAAVAAAAAADDAACRPRRCARCNAVIGDADLHKIVIYVVGERFTEHHYEHVECPGRFST